MDQIALARREDPIHAFGSDVVVAVDTRLLRCRLLRSRRFIVRGSRFGLRVERDGEKKSEGDDDADPQPFTSDNEDSAIVLARVMQEFFLRFHLITEGNGPRDVRVR